MTTKKKVQRERVPDNEEQIAESTRRLAERLGVPLAGVKTMAELRRKLEMHPKFSSTADVVRLRTFRSPAGDGGKPFGNDSACVSPACPTCSANRFPRACGRRLRSCDSWQTPCCRRRHATVKQWRS